MTREASSSAARLLALAFGLGATTAVNTSCAAPRDQGASDLRCELTAPARVAAGQRVPLRMVLHNDGKQPQRVLNWGTPFETRWLAPYVGVSRNGVELPYGGASMKRGDPAPASYLRVDPAQSIEASIDLGTAFNLTVPGSYRLLPRITLHDVVVGGAPAGARPRALHQPLALACNALAFEVTR